MKRVFMGLGAIGLFAGLGSFARAATVEGDTITVSKVSVKK